jgi:hypothetical protein
MGFLRRDAAASVQAGRRASRLAFVPTAFGLWRDVAASGVAPAELPTLVPVAFGPGGSRSHPSQARMESASARGASNVTWW